MKFVAITLLAFVAAAIAGPITISDNKIGDIVTVSVNANAVLSSNIEADVKTLIGLLANQQAVAVDAGSADLADPAIEEAQALPAINITPEMIEQVKSHISPALIEKF